MVEQQELCQAETRELYMQLAEANNTISRYETLIVKQGAFLHTLGDLVRGNATRKELKKYVNKYGIGV